MKTILKSTLLIFSVILWQSCDKVSPPYKETVAVISSPRKVLVEDYTGHKCGNCPRASRALYDLKPIYGENLIIMAVHAGFFAQTNVPPYLYDFKTSVGTQLDTDFGISNAGNPNGMVNRRLVNSSYIIASTAWASEVNTVLTDPSPVPLKISINNDYNSSSRELQTEVEMEFFTTLTGDYKLCVFMVEDSIVNWQKDYDVIPNDVPDYVHREVLRGSMNGTYGNTISETTEGAISSKNYSYSLPIEWNDTQVSIIAFLYDVATKEIIQVEQAHIE
jgi:hypothetical protein